MTARGPGGSESSATPLTDLQLFFTGSFDRALAGTSTPIQLFRHTLRTVDEAIEDRFRRGTPAADLIQHRAWYMDEMLIRAWDRMLGQRAADMALVAVGGYGRSELHPHSDIDLLILCPPSLPDDASGAIERLLAFLWDIGLKVGHSVRTVSECVEEAQRDVGVATNLMEARIIAGSAPLYEDMRRHTDPPGLWPAADFYEAKLAEQAARHRKFHDTAYNLEPNVKDGPGGMRDLQTILWMAQRHFSTADPAALVERGFLTGAEREELIEGRNFLWQVRLALHLLAGRDENRLLFDHQQALAREFGYRDDAHRLAVEKFMKDYYRAVTGLARLEEMLLQLLHEVIFRPPGGKDEAVDPINRRFHVRNGFIEAASPTVFAHYPFALLEIFLLLQQRPTLRGVGAETIRLIRAHRHLIDDRFRGDLRCRALFMEILRQPHGVSRELRRMNRYGILGAYFPAFGQIIGQMQYDLFHAYTVDEHTLHVVANLRRFLLPVHEAEFPLCSRLAARIPKPELLYLAALFHDIAKGRGGDHSVLGADEAYEFCILHGLGDHDARLVAWLVRHHLEMSTTAQHRDIGDPEVIYAFAKTMGEQMRLDYLYLLTVADIRATNPRLWNNWKDALLKELYLATRQALNRGLENPVERRERVAETREAALALLSDLDAAAVGRFWDTLDEDDYFLRHSPDEIEWQTRQVLSATDDDSLPLVVVREQTARGGTELLIYARDDDHLFALATGALDQLGLNILSARIVTTDDGHTLHTYIVLNEDGTALTHPLRIEEAVDTILQRIASADSRAPRVTRRPARQLRHFLIPTEVVFSSDMRRRYTIAQLVTVDRPGLLARVGRAFVECGLRILHARIATFGERVEDVFFITDQNDLPIDDESRLTALQARLTEILDEP